MNRRNVSADVSENVNGFKRFLMLEIDTRIVAATMTELGIQEADAQPDTSELPLYLINTNEEKKKFVNELAERAVDKYVLREDQIQAVIEKTHKAEEQVAEQLNTGCRYKCWM